MRSPFGRTLALAVLLTAACTSLPAAGPTLKVLFLGNSLTGRNDVPGLVQDMARLQGIELKYTAITPDDFALEDHWRGGNQSLLKRKYDVVILQQGPSTRPESQANLAQWAVTWGNEARRCGTRPALFMVWPVRTQAGGFTLVAQSYRQAALAADAAILPAGEAWQQVLRADPAPGLYSADDLHATPAGSFLAAMVIARGLFGLDPEKIPARLGGITLPAATLARFRAVVATLPDNPDRSYTKQPGS